MGEEQSARHARHGRPSTAVDVCMGESDDAAPDLLADLDEKSIEELREIARRIRTRADELDAMVERLAEVVAAKTRRPN